MDNQNNALYDIPYKSYSSYKLRYHLLFLFMILFCGAFIFIPFDSFVERIFMRTTGVVLAAFVICPWFYAGVLKKQYIEITEDYIKYKYLFNTKIVYWNEIYDIQVFTQSYNTFIGIALKEKIKNRKESFWNMINDMYGGMYSIRILMAQFSEVDIEKLYGTITAKLIESSEKKDSSNQNIPDYNEIKAEGDEVKSNFFLAVLKALFLSITIGLVYGLSIYFLKVNIIVIPIFGTIAILYYYSKSYKEEKINIFPRILMGTICAFQIFIAVILVIFIDNDISFSLKNLIDVTREYFLYLIEKPFDQGITIFMAVLCFGYGALQGHTFKFQRKFKKLFMKHRGRYYYSREGRIVTVYLIDPAEYREDEQGKLLLQIYQGCQIEKYGKKLKGLCIPKESIDESEVIIRYDSQIKIDGKDYYKIDLGSNGESEPYLFPCILIMNSRREVEVIRVELH